MATTDATSLNQHLLMVVQGVQLTRTPFPQRLDKRATPKLARSLRLQPIERTEDPRFQADAIPVSSRSRVVDTGTGCSIPFAPHRATREIVPFGELRGATLAGTLRSALDQLLDLVHGQDVGVLPPHRMYGRDLFHIQ